MIGKHVLLLLTRIKASPKGASSVDVATTGIMPSLPTGELEVMFWSRTQGVHLPNKHLNVAVKPAIFVADSVLTNHHLPALEVVTPTNSAVGLSAEPA